MSPAATIDLDSPRAGIRLGDAAASAADHLLGLELQPPWRLVDHWPRGADVTAVYESDDARHLRMTAMWRLHSCAAPARAWQAVVSAQTSLLQSDPLLAVTATLASGPGDELSWGEYVAGAVHWRSTPFAAATCVLLRRHRGPAADGESVLVAGHPGEMHSVEVRGGENHPSSGRVVITCWIFSSALEKGVLLRSRVLAAVGPAAGDEAWAAETLTAFAALPPMLTT